MGLAALGPSYEVRLAQSAKHDRRIHPGSGRRRGPDYPKGRQVDPDALDEVQALLGERERRADLLIEHLHLLQDHFGCLYARHLVALAEEMRLALAEVYEVASFYAHFDIVMDEETAPPAITVRVCDSLSCALAGGETLLEELRSRLGDGVRVVRAPCMGGCDKAPAVAIAHALHENATADSVAAAVAAGETHPHVPRYPALDGYRASGGYKLFQACLGGQKPVEEVIKALEDSGLRGLGGAGFPTGRKWRFVRQEPKPRLMAVNADEGEPGTFKDRYFLETDPHRFLEGMLIGTWAVEAADSYIYLRDEYPQCHEILAREIAAIEAAGLAPHTKIHLRRGAGAYICGEESAMLESIEGRRGLPRHKPPFPSQVGLFGRPTLINNVETLFWVPHIGSAAVVVLSDKDDMKAVALNLLRFFEDESCGQCTPCRVGTEKAVMLMNEPRWDEDLLAELTRVMTDASICGLGQAAMNPVKMVVKHFRGDLTGGERA